MRPSPSLEWRLGGLALLGLSAYWSLRLGWADLWFQIDTPETVARAVQLVPSNARYLTRWAAFLDQAGRTAQADAALSEAARVSPYSAAVWIEVGLRAELAGDLDRAQSCLLRAAAVDKTFLPRWTLINYYLRRRDPENFWPWAREASRTVYGDPRPLFRLCWRMTREPEVIWRGLSLRPDTLGPYLDFLLDEDRLEAAAPAARVLLEAGARGETPALLRYCERLIEWSRLSEAVEIWNGLASRRWIPYGELAPQQGISLANADFARPFSGRGFDWRPGEAKGIELQRLGSEQALRVGFSGLQPERCEILSQRLALEPGRGYRFRFEHRSAGLPDPSGLRWRLLDLRTGAELWSVPAGPPGADWSERRLAFSMPPRAGPARLVLIYHREAGSTRIEGSFWLRRLALEFNP